MFVYHENASGEAAFTRSGDAYAINEKLKIAAVADSPLRELLRSSLRRYPQDDSGFDAAQLFCNSVVGSLGQIEKISKQSVLQALKTANQAIAELNLALGREHKDWLTYDVAETVGVVAVQEDNKLIYGGLEDCYVFVLRGDDFQNVAPFNYRIAKSGRYVEKVTKEQKYFKEMPAELIAALLKASLWEPVWCNVLRNNPDVQDENGKPIGWGCFTGETEAEKFFQVHELELHSGDHVFLLSDGMLSLLNNPSFVKWFVDKVNHTFKFGLEMRREIIETLGEGNSEVWKEKTLVY